MVPHPRPDYERNDCRETWKFYDADDYHFVSRIEPMRWRIPLADEDFNPWLPTPAELINDTPALHADQRVHWES